MTVTIRRCVLRVRRHGGWSWGPDPDGLLNAATQALPQLIAKHVGEVTNRRATGTHRIVTPLRLRVTTTLEQLAALAAAARLGEDMTAVAAGIANELERSLDQVLEDVLADTDVLASGSAASADAPEIAKSEVTVRHSSADATLALLARWSRAQVILEVLASAPPDVATAWLAQIQAKVGSSADALRDDEQQLVELTTALHSQLVDIHGSVFAALVAIGAVAAMSKPAAWHRAAAIALTTLHALASTRPGEEGSTPVSSRTTGMTPGRHPHPDATPSVASSSPRILPLPGDVVVPRPAPVATCALPFLAMVSLSRCGWLAAVGAILDAADAVPVGPALAAGIAYKLVTPPELGWRRRPEHRAAARALAGRDVDDAELHDVLDRLASIADVLIAPLTAELRQGHRRGAPLLLTTDGEGYALVDTEGTFLISTSPDVRVAIAAARDLGDVVLVPAAIATAQILDRIESANLVFVTDGPPQRHQPWRPVPGVRLWTNDGGMVERHRMLVDVLADAEQLAAESLDALRARPALLRGGANALDRIATHASALALGDLAWNLFRRRESPSPFLALERFATLDATVESDDDRIEVRIPLGRRHSDLLAHGYLTAVADVPWLDGRVLHIMGG